MRTIRSAPLALLTEPEARLVLESAPRNLRELDRRQLKRHAVRARGLESKYRGLAQRQEREARRKVRPTRGRCAEGSQNTARKAELFGTARERFETRLEQVERAEARAEAQRQARAKKQAARKRAAKRTGAPARSRKAKRAVTAAAKAKGSARRAQKHNLRRRNAQTAARVRKTQVRKDRR